MLVRPTAAIAVAALLGVAAPSTAGAAAGPAQAYVVQGATTGQVTAALGAVGARPDEVFAELGAASVELTDAQARRLDAQPGVDVTLDPPAHLADATDPTVQAADSQSGALWNLDRMDAQAATRDNVFRYPGTAGAGVVVYVVDSGVAPVSDFGGRVTTGRSFVAGEPDANVDATMHGTHVAGTVASATYGVAKKATIVPLKVIGASGTGNGSDIVAALDWILANHPAGTPGVVNMSLEVAAVWSPLNTAVKALTDDGLFVAVAAGNDGADACGVSPASAPSAFTTGATTNTDARASFSNWGTCLDGFAPGASVVSVVPTEGMVGTMSGTSMASPHVAGLAALALGQDPTITPTRLRTALLASAPSTVVGAGTGSPGVVVNDLALPSVGTPSGLRVTATTTSSLSLAWAAPVVTTPAPVATYTVTAKPAGSSSTAATTTVAGTQTTATLTGLAPSTAYDVQVTATATTHSGAPTSALRASTAAPAPGAPTNLQATTATRTATLTWTAPDPVPGAVVTGYRVAWRAVGTSTWSTATAASTTATLADLGPSIAYEATVAATSASATGSAATVGFTTPPSAPPAPTHLAATVTATTAALTWSAAPGADGYTVRWRVAGGAWSSLTTTSPTLTLGPLSPATGYEVEVAATNAEGTGPAATATVTTAPPPPVPTGVAAASAKPTTVTVRWTAAPGSREVRWRTPGGTWATRSAGTATSLRLDGLAVATSYEVQVRAVAGGATSAWSASVLVTTQRWSSPHERFLARFSATVFRHLPGPAALTSRAQALLEGVAQVALAGSGADPATADGTRRLLPGG